MPRGFGDAAVCAAGDSDGMRDEVGDDVVVGEAAGDHDEGYRQVSTPLSLG